MRMKVAEKDENRRGESNAGRGVAVLFDNDLDYATAVYQGVQEHISTATGWPVLPLASGSEAALGALLAAGRLRGIIGPFVSDKWIQSLGLPRVPMVNVGNLSDIKSVDAVTPDDREVGRMAARVFVEGGVRYFGFAGISGIFHDVAAVAHGIGVSRRLLEMRCKAVLKRSPYQELLRLRMEQAVYLLTNTTMKVFEVGLACGFPEPHHFSALFKKWSSRSPQVCRKGSFEKACAERRGVYDSGHENT